MTRTKSEWRRSNANARRASINLPHSHFALQSSSRWWIAVLVGAAMGVPIGWLLSYAAALPNFIGVFFFALLGLVIGAIIFRIASPMRPFPNISVIAGTTAVTAIIWTGSIVKEALDFPTDMGQAAANQTRDLGGRSLSEFRNEFASQVRGHLRSQYPPGGTIGYIRWVLTSGELKKGDAELIQRTMHVPQARIGWAIRVVLSAGLLAFGVASQTLPLSERTARSGPEA